MARARTIKHGFFTNDDLCSLPPLTRILFAGLWCVADKEGRLLDRPRKIKADVLPYDHADVGKALDQLAEAGFIRRYEVDGQGLIQVLNWHKHQNPHPREVASELPAGPLQSNGPATAEQLPDPGEAVAEPRPSNSPAMCARVAIPSGSSFPSGSAVAGRRDPQELPRETNGGNGHDQGFSLRRKHAPPGPVPQEVIDRLRKPPIEYSIDLSQVQEG